MSYRSQRVSLHLQLNSSYVAQSADFFWNQRPVQCLKNVNIIQTMHKMHSLLYFLPLALFLNPLDELGRLARLALGGRLDVLSHMRLAAPRSDLILFCQYSFAVWKEEKGR